MALICRLTHHQPTRQLVRVSWRSVIGQEPDEVRDGDAYRWATFCSRCGSWLEAPAGAELPSIHHHGLTAAGVVIGSAGCLIVAAGLAWDDYLLAALSAPVVWGVFMLWGMRSHRVEIEGFRPEKLPPSATPNT